MTDERTPTVTTHLLAPSDPADGDHWVKSDEIDPATGGPPIFKYSREAAAWEKVSRRSPGVGSERPAYPLVGKIGGDGAVNFRGRAKVARRSAHLAVRGAPLKLGLLGDGEGYIREFVVDRVEDCGEADGVWVEFIDPASFDLSAGVPDAELNAVEITFTAPVAEAGPDTPEGIIAGIVCIARDALVGESDPHVIAADVIAALNEAGFEIRRKG